MKVVSEQRRVSARERARAWYWKNRERSLAASWQWAEKNRELIRARTRRWRADNPERARENDAKKRANRSPAYLESRRIDEQNRRARIKLAGGRLSKGLSERLLQSQSWSCVYCHADLRLGFHLDHVIPIFLGGKNEDGNIQLLCPTCNRRKHTKRHEEFLAVLG
jgi:5-methylcytosine-specific restriction endonuclease McrA